MSVQNRKILVVEDDAGIRDSLMELFRSEGYEVYLAEDGRRGLELMRDVKPFMVLLDLMMPVMDGSAFLADLEKSEDKRIASTPVVLLTAAGAKNTSGCKVHEVLIKPIDIDVLLNVAAKYSA
ncbi:MAG: response regulator [Bdellovibrionota bacterium]